MQVLYYLNGRRKIYANVYHSTFLTMRLLLSECTINFGETTNDHDS